MDVTITTAAARPELIPLVWDMPDSWPEFINHDPIAMALFTPVAAAHRDLALIATAPDGTIVAHGTAMGLRLHVDGRRELPVNGWDGALVWAYHDVYRGVEPDTACADGLPVDSWLRVHARLGGVIVGVAPTSQTISGTLDQWREWTGEPFDTEGPTIVPNALAAVHCFPQHGYGVYVEPNVWVRHDLT